MEASTRELPLEAKIVTAVTNFPLITILIIDPITSPRSYFLDMKLYARILPVLILSKDRAPHET